MLFHNLISVSGPIAVGRPVTCPPSAQTPACGIIAPGSPSTLAFAIRLIPKAAILTSLTAENAEIPPFSASSAVYNLCSVLSPRACPEPDAGSPDFGRGTEDFGLSPCISTNIGEHSRVVASFGSCWSVKLRCVCCVKPRIFGMFSAITIAGIRTGNRPSSKSRPPAYCRKGGCVVDVGRPSWGQQGTGELFSTRGLYHLLHRLAR